jgi:hypothetical protein
LKSNLIAHPIPFQRVRFVICLTAAPISALKTASGKIRFHFLVRDSLWFRRRQRSRCRIFRGTIRNLLPSRDSVQNALDIFGRRR